MASVCPELSHWSRGSNPRERSYIDEAVKRMVEVHQEKKVAGLEFASKNMGMYKSREELGLLPATKPTGTMADSSLYFNWRWHGKGSRSPEVQGPAQWHLQAG
jgi:hypothetical protein